MDLMKNYGYDEIVTVVTFPQSDQLKGKPWFNECCLINDQKGISIWGMGAYVVPVRLLR